MSTTSSNERDFLGGKPINTNARLLGFRAVNVLKAVSVSFCICGLAFLMVGIVTGNLKISLQLMTQSIFNGCIVLIAVYFCKLSYVYACCACCGIFHCCISSWSFIAFVVFIALAASGLIDMTSIPAEPLLSTPFSIIPPEFPIEILIFSICSIFTIIIINSATFAICATAFWQLSNFDNHESQETPSTTDRYEVEDLVKTEKTQNEKPYYKSRREFMLKPVLFDNHGLEKKSDSD